MDFRQILMTAATQGGSSLYSAQALSLFARMTSQPDATRKGLINNLIASLISAGVWSKLDLLYLTAAHDAQAARLNWIASANNLSAFNSPTFTTDRGYAGNGTTSYLDTGLAPNASVALTLNSGALGAYVNAGTNDSAATRVAIGCTSVGAGAVVIPRAQTSDRIRGRVNSSASADSTGPAASILGFTLLNRVDASNVSYYRDATLDSTVSSASSSLATASLILLANNGSGTPASFSDARVAMAFAGAGLTGGEITALNTAVLAYLTAIGAN